MTRGKYTVNSSVGGGDLMANIGNGQGEGNFLPLHLADSLQKLINRSELKKITKPMDKYVDMMRKLDPCIKHSCEIHDQELEYMYIYKYLTVVNWLKSSPNYHLKKNKYTETLKNSRDHLNRFELLTISLESRYKEKYKLMGRNHSSNKKLITPKDSSTKENEPKEPIVETTNPTPETSINSNSLYLLITNTETNETTLLLDARSNEDFEESHINCKNIINIPEEVNIIGISATQLGKSLNPEAFRLWKKRCDFDKLIVLDWGSSEASLSPQSRLHFLREAMCRWDPSSEYKCQPLILNGGFEDFLSRYPRMTTNPKAKPSHLKAKDDMNNLLNSFDYPIEELEEKKVVIQKPPVVQTRQIVVDRTTKPKVVVQPTPPPVEEPPQVPQVPRPVLSVEESSSSAEESLPPEPLRMESPEGQPAPSSTPVPPVDPKSLLNHLRRVKPDTSRVKPDQTIHSQSPTHLDNSSSEDIYTTPLKKDATSAVSSNLKRSSSSPNINQLKDDDAMKHPTFNRAMKPSQLNSHNYDECTDAIHGRTAALGLTGLKNFANNCYMNSILQCLSNTEALVNELTMLQTNQVQLNSQSKTKGQVAQEVMNTLRWMWSGDIKVYSIKKLKELMGNVKDIFKGTSHQDSNEFLIILLEYLHEDLNVIQQNGIITLAGAEEATGEKAWGEFLQKNFSVIQRLFYGQQKSTVTCTYCGHSSITFEPFFNLFVPIPSNTSASLNECIQMYMSGEKISGWKCPKCQTERNATKKFDISLLPPILIIALKRFTQENDSWLHKKETVVSYPLEDLEMEGFTVEGSEQRFTRYNLYAISTHSGTLKSGHYRAICKNFKTNKWYMFDDQSVDPMPSQQVSNNSEAYILFYNSVKFD